MVLRPTPRLADARPDREERRGLPAAHFSCPSFSPLFHFGVRVLGGRGFPFLFCTENPKPISG